MIKPNAKGFLLTYSFILIFSCKNSSSQHNSVVIGEERNQANQKEDERLNDGQFYDSPLKDLNYSIAYSGKTFENPKEVELDQIIIALSNRYKESDSVEREVLRSSLNQEDFYKIIIFCERATVFKLREQNNNIESSLLALSMVDPARCDPRDAFVSLSFVHHVLQKDKSRYAELYQEAVELANPEMKKLFDSFKKIESERKKIESIAGYTEYNYESGIGFIECGFSNYAPRKDLASMLLAINEQIQEDKYKSGDVSIAQDLGIFWIESKNDDQVRRLLKNSLGTAKLKSSLRKEFSKESESQMLLLYLVEFEESNEANELKKLLGQEKSDKFARIFGVSGNIFYILVARSVISGIDDYESIETLQRFRAPIENSITNKNSH